MKTAPLLFFVCLLFAFPIYAAEENGNPDNPAPQTEQAGPAEDAAAGDNSQAAGEGSLDERVEGIEGPLDENFVPTVQITEDLPVAFPVDI